MWQKEYLFYTELTTELCIIGLKEELIFFEVLYRCFTLGKY